MITIEPPFRTTDQSLCSVHMTSLVLERLVLDQISDHVNNLISPSQFGFRKGHSTVQQLLTYTADLFENSDKHVATDSIYLDLKKAFDSIPHPELLQKLVDTTLVVAYGCGLKHT